MAATLRHSDALEDIDVEIDPHSKPEFHGRT
jgi:hypothetical protein